MFTTLIGLPIDQLDTPALLVDLDMLESNIASISGDIHAHGSSWRPHSKSHKCPAIAHKQIEAGAIGIACAKLGEAEVMANNGIRDILIPNQIVGPIKARRLAALGRSDRHLCVGRQSGKHRRTRCRGGRSRNPTTGSDRNQYRYEPGWC